MKAMQLQTVQPVTEGSHPLVLIDREVADPAWDQILVKISACGVCHTELDEIEGRTPPPFLPVIPGHQIVGRVERKGSRVQQFTIGQRVGIGWIYSACGTCDFCRNNLENLCPSFCATGRDRDGGYAEYAVVPAAFSFPVPETFSDCEAAPLLCAGGVGYRSLRLSQIQDGQNLGFTGFGASGHLVLMTAKYLFPHLKTFVFARSAKQQKFALKLGADWAGNITAKPPQKLQAIIDTTPVWQPVIEALEHLECGGRLVINAIRKENIDREHLHRLDYQKHLWQEKELKSVANVSRADIIGFLRIAAEIPIRPEVQTYRLEEANQALLSLKSGNGHGAKVILM